MRRKRLSGRSSAKGRPKTGRHAGKRAAGRRQGRAARRIAPRGRAADALPAAPPAKPPAGSLEAYQELEKTFYLLRDALEAAESFDRFGEELRRRNIPEERVRRIADLGVEGDLHLHSNVSDGRLPPQKLPWLARALGLRTIGITDHDSVDGCREAFREGMLIGVHVLVGVELSTEQAGLEILAYFPDAGKFFSFLTSARSERFREALARRQEAVHRLSLACLEHVNRWLRRQNVPAENPITLQEYDGWFGGRKPYFPGTLCVLGLKRLAPRERDRLKIHDPRTFNTRVVTPFLEAYRLKLPAPASRKEPKSRLEENFSLVRALARAGVPVATFIAHPKELLAKGRMSLGQARKMVFQLARQHGLDGLEVACARDTEDDIRYWKEVVADYDAGLATAAGRGFRKPLLEASYSSDFHVLAPGLATGEITIGFGTLDSRPAMRRGNLRPQMALGEFLEQLRRRANENAGL